MAKFSGKIGYLKTEEIRPGIWEPQITEKSYVGDIINSNVRFQSSGNLNDNITISNKISIIADSFAKDNLNYIAFVEYMGVRWKISNIEVNYPRLILTMGEVYNDV